MKKKAIIDILFIAYMLILLRITVFRSSIGSHGLLSGTIKLIPFTDIFLTLKRDPLSFIYLFFGNILWFVPFGLYMGKARHCKLLLTVTLGFLLSLFIEIMQYVFGTGVSDIEDLILNTTGVLIGGCIAHFIDKRKKTNKKFKMNPAVGRVITAIVLYFVWLIIYSIMFIIAAIIYAECPFLKMNTGEYANVTNVIFCFIASILILHVISAIIFKHKTNKIWKYPLFLMAVSFAFFLFGTGITFCGYEYYSHFTPQKWQHNPDCRYLMIDSLENKYQITGMSEQEITELLGSPEQNIPRGPYVCYEYFISQGSIDPITYDIYFTNHTAVRTAKTEH